MEHTKQLFRMSECGHCPRKLTYKYLGYSGTPFPAWLESSAREGKLHELWLLDELRADDISIYGEQMVLKLSYPLINLEGHPDALENDHGIERVVECKSMSQNEYQRWMSQGFNGFPNHAAQITAYMTATGLPSRLIVKNRNTGTTHGLNSTDTKYFMEQTPCDINDIVLVLSDVAECIANGELYPGVEYQPDNVECKRCQFGYLCTPPPPVLAKDQEAQLTEEIAAYRAAKVQADAAGLVMDSAKTILRQYAEIAPTHSLTFNGLTAKVYPVKSVSYPKAEVEKLLDADTLRTIAKTTERMDCRITDKGEVEDND